MLQVPELFGIVSLHIEITTIGEVLDAQLPLGNLGSVFNQQ